MRENRKAGRHGKKVLNLFSQQDNRGKKEKEKRPSEGGRSWRRRGLKRKEFSTFGRFMGSKNRRDCKGAGQKKKRLAELN